MRTKKIPDFKYFLLIVMIGCGCIGGGYFCYVSAVLSVLLLGALVYQLWCAKRLLISCDINLLAFSLISVSYFLVSLWAVDSGMSLMGGMKFLPVILLFFTDVSDYGGRTAGIDRMASSGGQCYDGSILSYDADSGV